MKLNAVRKFIISFNMTTKRSFIIPQYKTIWLNCMDLPTQAFDEE